jgi:hypothetical protein
MKQLTAENGHKLTQSNNVPIENRIIADSIILAVNDSEDNYVQITQAQADEYIKQQEEARNNVTEESLPIIE